MFRLRTANFILYNFVDFDWFTASHMMIAAYTDVLGERHFNGVKTGQLVSNVSPIIVSKPPVSGNTGPQKIV